MRSQDMLEWVKRDPFVPFRVHLSNGKQFDVLTSDMAMVGKNDVVIGERDPDFPLLVFDRAAYVALIHINYVQPIGAPAAAAG